MTVGIGLAGVHVLRGRDEGDSFQQGYELGRRVVHLVEDGTSPQTACETMVWADQIGRGARYSRAEVQARTAGCLEAVSDVTER
ncbi:amidohydrolase [Mycobacterium sp. PO1]|nr:amidohydrolase [Mycobacterium sp. PO1]GFM24197.1 Amidohydrolase [Mycobacterium sp. PO2]